MHQRTTLLVSPSKVTVVGAVDTVQQDPSEQELPHVHSSAFFSQEVFTVSHHSASEFVHRPGF